MKSNILEMVKLHISYDNVDEGIVGEYLWATPIKNGIYRLENEPLAEGLFFHDIVKASYQDGILEFESFLMREVPVPGPVSGRKTP